MLVRRQLSNMKVLAVILLCGLAAVQARSAVGQRSVTEPALGEKPYMVHLRVARNTGGLLYSCAGTLIGSSWVLTAQECAPSTNTEWSRFIWVRYGVVNVMHPSLVTETNVVNRHSEANLALISINRRIETTDNIQPIGVGGEIPESSEFCAWGELSEDVPGEQLGCYSVTLTTDEDGTVTATSDVSAATKFDLGAPLVSEGKQVAVLVGAADGDNAGTFLPLADYVSWIEEVTGISFD